MWGRKAMGKLLNKKVEKTANSLAKEISKEDFLAELRVKWWHLVKRTADTEEEIKKARLRIEGSKHFKGTFDIVGITDEDLRAVIEDIKARKPEQTVLKEAPVGRNSPCPCGSNRKYKKCCMNKEPDVKEEQKEE